MTSPSPSPGLAQVLDGLRRDPGRPRLTWYGPDGERIELSGHVLDNWVAKTANLLVEELDCGPGTTVRLDLPPHWRAVVWALAVWRVGAHLSLDPDSPADVAVTSRPGEGDSAARTTEARETVVVALPALARRWDGPLPSGAIDAAQAVMTYGDVLGYAPPTEPDAPALTVGGVTVPHRGLVAHARGVGEAAGPVPVPSADQDGPQRTLVEPGDGDLAPTLLRTLDLYVRDGSVVLCSPGVARALADDPPRRERLVATERVTRA